MTATKRKPKPITANPLFPFVTALWLATFLGLGSFAIAPALLEGPVVALGIPALVPAAAPPLGFTARVMFALALMGLGAVAGYIVGRMLGREKVAEPVRTRGFGKAASAEPAVESRRPINAAEDLGAPLDSPVENDVPLRRRALALNDESQIAAPADVDQLHQPYPAVDADPLSLDLFLEEANAFEPAPLSAPVTQYAAEVEAEIEAAQPEPTSFAAPQWSEPVAEQATAADEQAADVPSEQPAAPAFALPAAASPFLQAHAIAATPIDHAPLDSLGLVPLIERLALAISRRAAQPTTTIPPEPAPSQDFAGSLPTPPAPLARFEKAPTQVPTAAPTIDEIDEDAPAAKTASTFASAHPERVVQLRPAALHTVQSFTDPVTESVAESDGAEDEEDLGLERFLRMSPLLARKPAHVADEADIDGEDSSDDSFAPEPEVAEERYPSLLDMGPVVVRREPLRIEDSEFESAGEGFDDERGIEAGAVFPGKESPPLSDLASPATGRPFERPAIVPLPGSPLASPGRASPSAQIAETEPVDMAENASASHDAEEADRALRAALATLQRMTAQG